MKAIFLTLLVAVLALALTTLATGAPNPNQPNPPKRPELGKDGTWRFDSGGKTIAGPGAGRTSEGSKPRVWTSVDQIDVCATVHNLSAGSISVHIDGLSGGLFFQIFSNEARTGCTPGGSSLELTCFTECDYIWRVDEYNAAKPRG